MPELVAFIPNCCVIAVVFKFLLFLCLVAHYFFLTFFPFPLPTPAHLQMLPLGSRSPAPPPPRERRSQRCTSWGVSRRESCGSTATLPSWKRGAPRSQVCLQWARSPWTCSDSMSVSRRSEVWRR